MPWGKPHCMKITIGPHLQRDVYLNLTQTSTRQPILFNPAQCLLVLTFIPFDRLNFSFLLEWFLVSHSEPLLPQDSPWVSDEMEIKSNLPATVLGCSGPCLFPVFIILDGRHTCQDITHSVDSAGLEKCEMLHLYLFQNFFWHCFRSKRNEKKGIERREEVGNCLYDP